MPLNLPWAGRSRNGKTATSPPPAREPTPIAAADLSWQRPTPPQGWMTIDTDPRTPAPVTTSDMEVVDLSTDTQEHAAAHDSKPARDRPVCPHCRGLGYVPTVNDYLRESVALISDVGDMVVTRFYERLFGAAPYLQALFPPDLLTAPADDPQSRGARQRDRLLKAIVAVATWYDPQDPDAMQSLHTALKAYGRSHSAFRWPEGMVRGATIDEYLTVRNVLFEVLHEVAGSKWRPEYDMAWVEAIQFVIVVMLHEQLMNPMSEPRDPRADSDPIVARPVSPAGEGV